MVPRCCLSYTHFLQQQQQRQQLTDDVHSIPSIVLLTTLDIFFYEATHTSRTWFIYGQRVRRFVHAVALPLPLACNALVAATSYHNGPMISTARDTCFRLRSSAATARGFNRLYSKQTKTPAE